MDNNIDKNLYNEKSLYLLNIKELRDIGRKFCVPSPTTKKKHELIDYILKVVYGVIKAPARSNYGRPNVREFELDKYLKKIKRNSDMTDELMRIKLEDDFLIGALKVAAPKENEPKDNIETRVYAEQDGKCLLKIYQFVDSEKDIEISREYAKNLNLEEQDVLEVRIEGDMCKIITINGVSVKNKFEEFVINSSKISAGSRKVFYVSTKEEREEEIKKIEEICENVGLKLFIFANKKYTGKCTESFVYDEDLDYPKMYKKFISMFSEWEKLALQGEDVVVLLENTEDVDDMLNSFDEGVNERTKNNVKSLIDRFVSLGNVFITFRHELKVKY